MEDQERAPTLLLIDDERPILRSLSRLLGRQGYEVRTAQSGDAALAILREESINLALVDYELPGMNGAEVIRRISAEWPETSIVAITGKGDAEVAFRMLREGANDYLEKPILDFHRFLQVISKNLEIMEKERELKELRARVTRLNQLQHEPGHNDLIGNSPAMRALRETIQQVGPLRVPILVVGESGVGKERVSRVLHATSGVKGPFLAINCAGLQKDLLESELFGHEAGAFTGAERTKQGLCEVAGNGTLLLDEIGELPFEMQASLLRVLHEREFRRVGGTRTMPLTARIVSATNVDLRAAITDRRFREDLYYRLNVFEIRVPPLRERRDDIPLLSYYFVQKYNNEFGRNIKSIEPSAMTDLQDYDWAHNNVRELERSIQRAVALCSDQEQLTRGMFQLGSTSQSSVRRPNSRSATPSVNVNEDLFGLGYQQAKQRTVEQFTQAYVKHQLVEAEFNITKAAKASDMQRPNFSKLMKKFGVDVEKLKDGSE